MKNKKKCPICNSSNLKLFLSRKSVPVSQNVVISKQKAAVGIPRHNLEMTYCSDCGFVFNQVFDLSRVGYGEDYDNNQACSSLFNAYLNDLIDYLVNKKKVQNCRIVEVGCGQGYFLKKLITAKGSGNKGIGFDPSYRGPKKSLNGRARFVQAYYGKEFANEIADVVISRHVIEHVPNPIDLLRSVRVALANSTHARVFFETPCVEWILRNRVIWDLFYEHCSLFSANSLTTAFEIAGFKVESVRHIFGGQYLWLEARVAPSLVKVRKNSGSIPRLSKQFSVSEQKLSNGWSSVVARKVKSGKVALWGAGAKGTTFVNLIDPKRRLVDSIVDVNPNKQGGFVPGTGHPIVRPEDLTVRKVSDVILMNPNYKKEILSEIKRKKIKVNLI